jgi:hypothetical protein
MDESKRGRFQFSIRTLLVVTAALALLLVPVAWVTRERQQMMLAERAVLQAREVALRSAVLEAQRREQAEASRQETAVQRSSLEQLQRENAELRRQVEKLRSETEQLKKSAKPAGAKPQ